MQKHDWQLIKKEFLCSDVSLAELARKHNISYNTIKKRSAREDWNRGRREAKKAAENALRQAKVELLEKNSKDHAASADKVYMLAKQMIENMDVQYILVENSPSAALKNYAGALKILYDIVKDTGDIQTLSERQHYELAREKLDIERQKVLGNTDDENESGVVLLPEVEEDA